MLNPYEIAAPPQLTVRNLSDTLERVDVVKCNRES
jgi:hypothetical protein